MNPDRAALIAVPATFTEARQIVNELTTNELMGFRRECNLKVYESHVGSHWSDELHWLMWMDAAGDEFRRRFGQTEASAREE